jgi:hypothetical protein
MPLEFVVGAVIGAAAASQKVRNAVRKGAIYSVGGALLAYDKLTAAAHNVSKNVRKAMVEAANGAADKPAPEANGAPEAAAQAPPAATPSS